MRTASIVIVIAAAACAEPVELGTTTSHVDMAEIYVAPWGSDAPDVGTGSPTQPFQTLTHAEQFVGPGTTVWLYGGRYPAMTFTPDWSGTGDTSNLVRVTVQAVPGETPIFDPREPCFDLPEPACVVAPWKLCKPPGDPMRDPACICGDGVDEYVSTQPYTTDTKWGTMLDLGIRLLSYSRSEDFCATNESDVKVPHSDPRPGFLVDREPDIKRVYTYRGPGLYWQDDEHDRIHVRLSHTHLDGGVGNYTGQTNPNLVRMAIAGEHAVAAINNADHITFRGIVFQNGGSDATFIAGAGTDDVVFDHCKFLGGRHVVDLGPVQRHTFTDCEFSALLGPWVSRDDVKDQYRGPPFQAAIDACDDLVENDACTFHPPSDCKVEPCKSAPETCIVGGTCKRVEVLDTLVCTHADQCHAEMIGTCRPTAVTLMLGNAASVDLEIANSEFRDGHDALQTWGIDTDIHHNLFENFNDEVFFADGKDALNLQIHHNLIRKSRHVFSHIAPTPSSPVTNGARYYYRNIIDNRVPTLSTHRLLADQLPIWKVGVDFKMDQPIGEFYAYQNTIVQANPRTDALSFNMSDTGASLANQRSRAFMNNVHITYDGNKPFEHLPTAGFPAESEGNVWHRRKTVVTATDYVGGATPPPGWNASGSFAYPKLRNVPDYGWSTGAPFENSDYSPAPGSVLCTDDLGVELPSGLPDEIADLDHTPGAIPCSEQTPVFEVGIDARFKFPIIGRPIAEAGDYTTAPDVNDDGFENVTLQASGSFGTGFVWQYGFGGPVIGAATVLPTAVPVGTSQYFLTVTDASSNAATDMREITVSDPSAIPHANLIRNPSFENGTTSWSTSAGVSIASSPTHFLLSALRLIGDPFSQGRAWQDVPIIRGGAVMVSVWIRNSTLPSQLARLRLEWYDASGALIAVQPVDTQASIPSYQHVGGGPFTAPSNAVTARVRLLNDLGSADAYFDDARLRIVDNLVPNAHFEDGLTGWVQNGAPGPAVTTTAANVRSANAAAEIVSDGAGVKRLQQVVTGIDETRTYNISGWIKTSLTGAGAKIDVVWLDSEGTAVAGVNTIGDLSTAATYTEVTEDVPAPQGATQVRIDLVVQGGAVGTAWFDDINLRAQ